MLLRPAHRARRLIQLLVNDDGPGVPEAELVSIVERGERRDAAGQGQGLGLAIVRDLADSHGCNRVLANLSTGGLSVSIKWVTTEPKHR